MTSKLSSDNPARQRVLEAPRVILSRHGLRPKKAWGQNFLGDASTQSRIAELTRAASGDTVVELGAGLGHLTAHLVGRGARVVAVERDRELAPVLREELASFPELQVLEADAKAVDFPALAEEAGGRLIVCGNLPYHLGSPIIFHVLDHHLLIKRLVVLLQKEVAERIAAKADTPEYGLLSVLLQNVADVEVALKVGRGAFVPPPDVNSAVLVAEFREKARAEVKDEAVFRRVVKAAFSQRRKTLSNALKAAFDKDSVDRALETAGIDAKRRGETLTVEEFAAIERAL